MCSYVSVCVCVCLSCPSDSPHFSDTPCVCYLLSFSFSLGSHRSLLQVTLHLRLSISLFVPVYACVPLCVPMFPCVPRYVCSLSEHPTRFPCACPLSDVDLVSSHEGSLKQ